jgi:hypothetical protein
MEEWRDWNWLDGNGTTSIGQDYSCWASFPIPKEFSQKLFQPISLKAFGFTLLFGFLPFQFGLGVRISILAISVRALRTTVFS